jgi:hypothetical protein
VVRHQIGGPAITLTNCESAQPGEFTGIEQEADFIRWVCCQLLNVIDGKRSYLFGIP